MKSAEVDWVFDALPPSGARRGGDPAKHAFEASLRVFVREVVQNAMDQAAVGELPDVHFRFLELEGEALTSFFEAVRWKTLHAHLAAAAASRGGTSIKKTLAELESRKKLLVLLVEDRGTVGLTGHEDEGESHFRALCKDTLYSHKQSEGAGGSYGLGKSVLWGFSGLSTVLFNSMLSSELKGQASPRLIGRAELPTHTVASGGKGGAGYAGSGWFGLKSARPPRAESLWGESAAALAAALRIERTNLEATGTSIQVLGFRDPTADADRTPSELAGEIRGAIEREFWPALAMSRLSTWVMARGEGGLLSEKELKIARPLVECYRRANAGGEGLHEPGDVVSREIEVEIPARRDGTIKATKGHIRLGVRLCAEHESQELMGQVAMFRSPGMVVRYLDQRALAKSSRPFYALVACGGARAPREALAGDLAIERFLRAAEPPGHDKWDVTEALKSDYERGYRKALDQLQARVLEALKSLMLDAPAQGKRGPERLRRKFPLGLKGGGAGSAKSAFRFGDVTARFEAGRWRFQGTIHPASPTPAWACEIRLAEIGEDGSKVGEVAVETLNGGSEGTTEIVDGKATIRTTAPLLRFEGQSVPGSSGKRALSLEIQGRTEVSHGRK